jgi:hypothetical protein
MEGAQLLMFQTLICSRHNIPLNDERKYSLNDRLSTCYSQLQVGFQRKKEI